MNSLPIATPVMVFALAVTTLLMFWLTSLTWPHRQMAGGLALIGTFLAISVWSTGTICEVLASSVAGKVACDTLIEYPGVVSAPVFFLLFVTDYTQQSRMLPARLQPALWVIPTLTLIMAWTNPWHKWLWSGFIPTGDNGLIFERGPYYAIFIAYTYTCLAIGLLALIRALFRHPKIYRRQAAVLLAAVLFPIAGNLAYVTNLMPRGLDITPIYFAVSGIALAATFLRHNIFTMIPVAREILVECLPDGVLVIDNNNRIIDANPAICNWMGRNDLIGKDAEEVFRFWKKAGERYLNVSDAQSEITIPVAGQRRYLDLRVVLLKDQRGAITGRLVTMRDITKRKQAEAQLRETNMELLSKMNEIERLQIELREKAIRDPLTGFFYRHYMLNALELEIAQSQRQKSHTSVAIIDLDEFKSLNSRYGHEAGEHVVAMLAKLVRAKTRRGDILCRYNGEEFAIVFTNTPLAIAHQRTEALRSSFAEMEKVYAGEKLECTFSAGLACFPEHGCNATQLLRNAEKALHEAKQKGQNCVCDHRKEDITQPVII